MKDEWTDAYSLVIPMLGIIISALGVSFSLLALTRSEAQTVGNLEPPTGVAVDIPKVRYSDSQVFVEVRNPGEWRELREFVQPDAPYLTHVIREALSG